MNVRLQDRYIEKNAPSFYWPIRHFLDQGFGERHYFAGCFKWVLTVYLVSLQTGLAFIAVTLTVNRKARFGYIDV